MLRYFVPPGCSKTSSHTLSKGAIDFEGLTSRLKPRPFKNKVRTRVFPQPAKARVFIRPERRLLEARGSQLEALVFRSWDNATVETGLAPSRLDATGDAPSRVSTDVHLAVIGPCESFSKSRTSNY